MKTIRVGKHEVIVDDWNYDRVKDLKMNARGKDATSGSVSVYWNQHQSRVGPGNKRHVTPLSKVIILTDAPVVDHKDRNWLNFQVANLRPCTRSQNQANQVKHRFGYQTVSRYKGVGFDKRRKQWKVKVRKNGREHWGGYFNDELEAARAYDALATQLHGEFAVLNFTL